MATHSTLSSLFTAIANAIRSKKEDQTMIVADDFPTAIQGIVTLAEGTSDATATAADILEGQTAYVNGVKVTGTALQRKRSASGLATPDFNNQIVVECGFRPSQVMVSVYYEGSLSSQRYNFVTSATAGTYYSTVETSMGIFSVKGGDFLSASVISFAETGFICRVSQNANNGFKYVWMAIE